MAGPKRVHPLPTPEQVRALVRYDGADFYWNPRPISCFKEVRTWRGWTTRCANRKIIIKRQLNGYDGIRIGGVLILLHRLIWVLHYGEWPKGEIDHLNGDHRDNRIENLRDVNKSQNMHNQRVRSDSTSGFPGVHFCPTRSKSKPWVARVGVDGTWKTLGFFATKEEAIECRKREQGRFGFTERHGTSERKLAA